MSVKRKLKALGTGMIIYDRNILTQKSDINSFPTIHKGKGRTYFVEILLQLKKF